MTNSGSAQLWIDKQNLSILSTPFKRKINRFVGKDIPLFIDANRDFFKYIPGLSICTNLSLKRGMKKALWSQSKLTQKSLCQRNPEKGQHNIHVHIVCFSLQNQSQDEDHSLNMLDHNRCIRLLNSLIYKKYCMIAPPIQIKPVLNL